MPSILNVTSNYKRIPIVAFVHLGKNPAPTLNWYAKIAKLKNYDFDVVLITDFPHLHKDFPGQMIRYDRKEEFAGFLKFKQKNRAYASVAGGYWLYSLERLFALSELSKEFDQNRPIIHLESDNLALFSRETIEFCLKRINKTSVVRYSPEDGIASILISPDLKTLVIDLEALSTLLNNNPNTRSDMSFLGDALNSNVLGELPCLPHKNWKLPNAPEKYMVFDGAALGQYLFGLDPVHTNNKQISGHINNLYPLPLNNAEWILSADYQHPLKITIQNKILVPMNLHIHSKILLKLPDASDTVWIRYINEANNLLERTKSDEVPDHIHSNRISIPDRIRLRIKRMNYSKKSRK